MIHVEPAQAQELPRLIDGRYQPTRLLGQGAFARTMACVDVRDGGRAVALKELRLQGLGDWKPVELFEREAQVLASLRHPAVPEIYRHFEGREEEARPGRAETSRTATPHARSRCDSEPASLAARTRRKFASDG